MTPADRAGRGAEDDGLFAEDEIDREIEKAFTDGDNVRALCLLVESAGLTMTLYGQPVAGPEELREAVSASLMERLASKAGAP
jgi:hypothetical protein